MKSKGTVGIIQGRGVDQVEEKEALSKQRETPEKEPEEGQPGRWGHHGMRVTEAERRKHFSKEGAVIGPQQSLLRD